jgi:membrane-bound lytic murein transglycosylase B
MKAVVPKPQRCAIYTRNRPSTISTSGEANFGVIQAWNAAPVYQRAIAIVGQQIDGH